MSWSGGHPTRSSPGKASLYMGHSVMPPMPGSMERTVWMNSRANDSCAAFLAEVDPSHL